MNVLKHLTRIPGVRGIWQRYPSGTIPDRVRFGIWPRPQYAFGVAFAVDLAKKLGIAEISVMEFGVAGGSGLLALEDCAARIGGHYGVKVKVWGFDAGIGMPMPVDYRDLSYLWGEGDYVMDVAALKARLQSAQLILGNVAETIPEFIRRADVPPIGFVSFDLDYYSSTAAALKILDGPHDTRLPRIPCYFDDIIWPEGACYNEFTGELLAINEYNASHETSKVAKFANLRWTQAHASAWHEQIYVHHDFKHPLYNVKLRGREQLHLR